MIFRSLCRGLFFSLLLVSTLVASAAPDTVESTVQSNGYSYGIGTEPAFVVRHANPTMVPVDSRSRTGLQIMLLDQQISLLGGEVQEYTRVTVRALDSQALQQVAQVYIEFNPDYQRLALHAIRVLRDGVAQDRSRSVKLDLLRREKGLEQNQYGGVVSAVAALPDVRVNDVVEYEFTITGSNPIFAGRYAKRIPVDGAEMIDERSVRLVHPRQRDLKLRVPAGARQGKEVLGDTVVETVNLSRIKAVARDTDLPAWYEPLQWIEISEYGNWDEVRKWAEGLFPARNDLAPELARKVADWKQTNRPPAELATEVLRWVQGEIRYFGIELGINSHLPVHPNQTVERRFGDCKDKSLLLASLLNGVGIEAHPVLVSMRLNRALEQALPSHAALDHAVVMARIDGRTYWLDATMQPQPGSINTIGVVDYGKALVLGAGQGGLADAGYPAGYRDQVATVDRYTVKAFNEPVVFETETTLAGLRAERIRWQISNQGSEEFGRKLQSMFQRLFPAAESLGGLEVRDDKVGNRLTLVSRYRIPDLFKYETGKLKAEVAGTILLEFLKLPDVPQRMSPFAIPHPIEVRQRMVFDLPENPIKNLPPPSLERTPVWSMRSQIRGDSRQLSNDAVLESLADHVAAAAMPAYVEDTQRLRRLAGFRMTLPVAVMSNADREALLKEIQPLERYGRTESDAVFAEARALRTIRQTNLDIASGKLTKEQLAKAYNGRGIAWDDTDHPDEALRDLDQAVALHPDNLRYKLDLASTLGSRGRFEESVRMFTDLKAAGRLVEAGAGDLSAFGRSLYYLERYEEAGGQFEEAMRRGERNSMLMAALWQHLAALRSNGRGVSQLEKTLGQEQSQAWPYAIGEMFLGKRSAEALIGSVKSDDAGIGRDQTCEANFYLGIKAMIDGERDKARDYFDQAYKTQVRPYTEFMLARYELGRLGGPKKGLMDLFNLFK